MMLQDQLEDDQKSSFSSVSNSVRLRSSKDRRIKQDFTCFREEDLDFMQHQVIKKNKLTKYENDNDYASD
jgi:hypothetical protein